MIPALLAAWVLCAPLQNDDAAKTKLKSAMDATSLTYSTSSSGLSYTLAFSNSDKRQQTVYVTLAPGRPGGLTTHTIYTTVWVSADTPPDEALLRKILARSKKLGSFYVFKDTKGVWALRFGVAFDATDLPETSTKNDPLSTTLKDLLYFVNAVGEETDKELNGEKDIR